MQKLTIQNFDDIYKIMEASFPKAERRTYEETKALFERENYHVYGSFNDENLEAFLVYYDIEDAYFIEYLASDPNVRGKAVGTKLLKECFQSFDKPVVFEVELPETDIAKRRIHFYQRLGCHLYPDFAYEMPSFYEGENNVPLLLMSYPDRVDESILKHYAKKIYEIVYEKKYM